MDQVLGTFPISHVNIRLSISMLLWKLLLIEIVAAALIILLHSSFLLWWQQNQNTNFLRLFNIPIFISLVTLKTLITIGTILGWLNEYYEITQKVIYHRKGLIFKVEEKYHLIDVVQIEVMQGVFGRFFNFGTIRLTDQRHNLILQMDYIHNPMRYASILHDLVPRASEVKHVMREHVIEKDVFDIEE